MRAVLCGGLLLAQAGCIAPSAPAPEAAQARPAGARSGCAWPGGAKAAASLTYDDALASQRQYGVPALEQHGLHATFFLSGSNLAAFAGLLGAGHELGSHTVRHPCNADLAALSAADMAAELDAGAAAVQGLGATGKLTFAYPCGQLSIAGGQSYVPLVQQRFRAARGVGAAVADPLSVDLFNVPALFPPTSSDGSDVIALLERAAQSGGWAVIGVHGVSEAGEYLQFSQAAHERTLAYLAAHRASIWTAPFGAVADHVAACRQRN